MIPLLAVGVGVMYAWRMMNRSRFLLPLVMLVLVATAGQVSAQFGMRTGWGRPLQAAHPAYAIEQARPDDFKPQVGALHFMPDGRLLVTSFKPNKNKSSEVPTQPNGKLYLIDNPTEKNPSKIRVTQITDDLFDPLGMNYVDGAVYISGRDEVSKWTDRDNDGKPDTRETFASGWISDNYHHFTFGLPYDGENFYVALSTNITFKNMIEEDNIKPNHVYHIRSNVASKDGEKMWSNEVWYTFHNAPK